MNRALGAIQGIVTDPNGRPAPDVAVMLGEGPAHPDIAAVTAAAGEFRFAGLDPGEYEVIANPPAAGTMRSRVTVEAGQISRVEFIVP